MSRAALRRARAHGRRGEYYVLRSAFMQALFGWPANWPSITDAEYEHLRAQFDRGRDEFFAARRAA